MSVHAGPLVIASTFVKRDKILGFESGPWGILKKKVIERKRKMR